MAKVTVKNDGTIFELPDGEQLLPYLKENCGFPSGCEKGNCGACACVIIFGAENLNEKSRKEDETLAKCGAPSSKRNRLACQVRVNKGEVVIEY